jgi:20S proteasome alpha/beta subunit
MDYMGTLQRVSYGAHGYASYFVSSIMANSYTNQLTLEQAIAISQQCVFELRKRMMVAQDHFMIKVVDAQGIRTLSA